MKPQTSLYLILLFLFNKPILAQDIDPSTFKSKVASRAVRDYLKRGEKATEVFLDEKQEATEELVSELEKVLKKTTSEGDLEEALKLRNSIDELKKNVAADSSQIASKLVGRWKIRYQLSGFYYNDIIKSGEGFKVRRWLEPDKELEKLETEPELRLTNGEIWIVWNNGERRDRVTPLQDGRICIEHWFVQPGKSMTEYPQQYAVGEKMKP